RRNTPRGSAGVGGVMRARRAFAVALLVTLASTLGGCPPLASGSRFYRPAQPADATVLSSARRNVFPDDVRAGRAGAGPVACAASIWTCAPRPTTRPIAGITDSGSSASSEPRSAPRRPPNDASAVDRWRHAVILLPHSRCCRAWSSDLWEEPA